VDVSVGCLDESTVAAFVEARLPVAEAGRVQRHAGECVSCHGSVVSAFARTGGGGAGATGGPGPAMVSARPSLAAGQAVGRYTVLGLVGRGGMGEVYAAYDPGLDRRIALKIISERGTAQSDNAEERLTREAQATAKLSHPNVVVVHDVGTFEGQVFLAMEFVEGVTLGAWLVERSRGWREVLAPFIQAGRGLAAAHAAGLVHRDFKPGNVMVAPDGAARVMDFGLARRIDQQDAAGDGQGATPLNAESALDPSLTRTGELVGTPLFMAPEQFAGGRVDARTDQFSFCVSLYWALCGVHPFGGSSRGELSNNVARGEVVSPAKKLAAPSRIQRTLLRGLSTNPDARWPSMDALIAELLRDPRRRRRQIAWAAVVGAVVCGVVALSAVQLTRRARATCSGGPDRMAGIWEGADRAGPGSRREMVRAAISRSGTEGPEQVWERISTALDRHATRWLAAYRDACEATHVRGEQSEDVLDLRMACLSDNLDSTRALTELISSGDRAVMDHAGEATSSLEDLGRCGATEQVRAGLRPPRDPTIRKVVDEENRQLKEGTALVLAGEMRRANTIADAVLTRREVASYCPVMAEALLLKGRAAADMAEDRGVSFLARAAEEGERCGHDRVVAVALSQLGYVHRYSDWAAAEREIGLASAAIARLGGDPLLEAWALNDLGTVRAAEGRYADAHQEFERSLDLKRRVLSLDNPDVGESHANLGWTLIKLGRFEEALAESRDAFRIEQKWNKGVWMANAVTNQGWAQLGLGRLDEAEASFGEAAKIFDHAAPGDYPDRLETSFGLAAVRFQRGDLESAIPILEKVLDGQRSHGVVATEIAQTQFKLAIALDRRGRDPKRATELARSALAAFAPEPTFESQRREVQAWLEHRTPRRKS
jgi:eukaryotic-like serine/threonine-protein kinase